MLLEKDFVKIPINIAGAIPARDGFYQLYKNYTWAVTEDDCILLYKGSPQCNINKLIVERHTTLCPWKTRAELLESVFLPHDCKDFI